MWILGLRGLTLQKDHLHDYSQTSIKRSPVSSDLDQLFRGPNELFIIVFTSVKRPL